MLEMVYLYQKRDFFRGKDVFSPFQKSTFWKMTFFGVMGGDFYKCVGGGVEKPWDGASFASVVTFLLGLVFWQHGKNREKQL